MPNLLLKLLDQWIDRIALPPAARGRFSDGRQPVSQSTLCLPDRVPADEAPSAATPNMPSSSLETVPDAVLADADAGDSTEDMMQAFNWD